MGLDNDDIKQLIAILQKGLANDSVEDQEIHDKPKQQAKKAKPKPSSQKKKSKNLFENMREAGMHKDDVAIDKMLNKLPPTARSRQYNPIKVRCRVCGRDSVVNPSLIESTERYKCNKCSILAG